MDLLLTCCNSISLPSIGLRSHETNRYADHHTIARFA